VEKNSIEVDRYRITFDKSGSVTELYDKQLNLNLLDGTTFNSYIYEIFGPTKEAGWHGTQWAPDKGTGRLGGKFFKLTAKAGPVFAEVAIERTLQVPGFKVDVGDVERIVETIRLYNGLDRIDCSIELQGKRPTTLAEAGYAAFPFAIPGFQVMVEQHGTPVNLAKDLHPGSNHDMHCTSRWVDVSNEKFGVTICPIDAPLVSIGEPRLMEWSGDYVPQKPHLYFNLLNNAWSTNFTEWQGGNFTFRFALKSHKGGWSEAPAFGERVAVPLVVAPSNSKNGSLEPSDSFLSIDEPGVWILAIKRAYDGDGTVIRLYESTGQRKSVKLNISRFKAKEAFLTDILEVGKPITVDKGIVRVELGPYAIVTLKIK
jgi:hypothetical protein